MIVIYWKGGKRNINIAKLSWFVTSTWHRIAFNINLNAILIQICPDDNQLKRPDLWHVDENFMLWSSLKLPSPISAAFHWAISWQVWSVQIRWSWVSLKRAIFPFSHSFCSPDFVITHFSVGKRMIITIEEMFPSMRLNRKIKGACVKTAGTPMTLKLTWIALCGGACVSL